MRSNPYELTPDKIQDPPKKFFHMLKYLGPGFILSASIVGSGELIATTILGATAGFVTLWMVLLSCLVKVTLQLEFGKHAIHSGESTFASFNRLPGPKLGQANWTTWTWLVLMSLKFLQVGGIVGGVAIIMQMILPWGEADMGQKWWSLVIAGGVGALVFQGSYKPIEKLSLIMIGLFTIFTLISVAALQSTEFAFSWADVRSGLTFQLPAETAIVIAAIGAFGITGVGGDEIMTYNYWLLEKGYAAKTGPRDDSPAWQRRARGWIRVMYWDALLSMVVYTIVTAAFYVLGASVLHGQGLIPEKGDLVKTLGLMYTTALGGWAEDVFLIGAFVVLFSTLFAALAGWTRLYSDCFARIGFYSFQNDTMRHRVIAGLALVIPFVWAILFIGFASPGYMVIIGGVATSVILLIVVFAAFSFRYQRLPDALRPGRIYDIALWVSAGLIIAVALYSLGQLPWESFFGGETPGLPEAPKVPEAKG